jgi:hypothetical protein
MNIVEELRSLDYPQSPFPVRHDGTPIAREAADMIERLRRNLEAHIVRNVGANGREYASPYWHCGFCRAIHQSPIAFEHKPDCMLAPDADAPSAEDIARDAVEIMRVRCEEAARIACLTLPEADFHAQQRARLHVTAAIQKLRHPSTV